MVYKTKAELYAVQFKKTEKLYNIVSVARLLLLLLFLVSLYFFTKYQDNLSLSLGIGSVLVFAVLLYFHNKIGNKKNLLNALLKVNKNEADFLDRKQIPYDDGNEFSPVQHPYAYDIDIL